MTKELNFKFYLTLIDLNLGLVATLLDRVYLDSWLLDVNIGKMSQECVQMQILGPHLRS